MCFLLHKYNTIFATVGYKMSHLGLDIVYPIQYGLSYCMIQCGRSYCMIQYGRSYCMFLHLSPDANQDAIFAQAARG